MNRDELITELKRAEGIVLKAYQDTEGIWTIGIGRNLEHVGVSIAEAEFMLSNDIDTAIDELTRAFEWFGDVDEVRQRVLVNMAFNLGITWIKGFSKFLAAMKAGDWETAAVEMMDSRWSKQVGARAERLRDMVLSG